MPLLQDGRMESGEKLSTESHQKPLMRGGRRKNGERLCTESHRKLLYRVVE